MIGIYVYYIVYFVVVVVGGGVCVLLNIRSPNDRPDAVTVVS